jgi:hypothetical protein
MIVWQLPSKEVQRIDTNHRWRCHAQARHMVGMAVPQLGQPRPCAIRVLQRSLEDGARRHRLHRKSIWNTTQQLRMNCWLKCNGQR